MHHTKWPFIFIRIKRFRHVSINCSIDPMALKEIALQVNDIVIITKESGLDHSKEVTTIPIQIEQMHCLWSLLPKR